MFSTRKVIFCAELNSGLPETGKPCEKWTQWNQLKWWNQLQWCKFANPVEHSRFPGKRELVWPGVLVWLRNLSPFLQRRASWSLLEEANPHLLLEALKILINWVASLKSFNILRRTVLNQMRAIYLLVATTLLMKSAILIVATEVVLSSALQFSRIWPPMPFKVMIMMMIRTMVVFLKNWPSPLLAKSIFLNWVFR